VRGDAGDLGQPRGGRQHRGAGAAAGLRSGGSVGVDALGGGDRRDELPDPAGQLVDLGGKPRTSGRTRRRQTSSYRTTSPGPRRWPRPDARRQGPPRPGAWTVICPGQRDSGWRPSGRDRAAARGAAIEVLPQFARPVTKWSNCLPEGASAETGTIPACPTLRPCAPRRRAGAAGGGRAKGTEADRDD
jgi:hypothetical protein